jgi:hypothetical protein
MNWVASLRAIKVPTNKPYNPKPYKKLQTLNPKPFNKSENPQTLKILNLKHNNPQTITLKTTTLNL